MGGERGWWFHTFAMPRMKIWTGIFNRGENSKPIVIGSKIIEIPTWLGIHNIKILDGDEMKNEYVLFDYFD